MTAIPFDDPEISVSFRGSWSQLSGPRPGIRKNCRCGLASSESLRGDLHEPVHDPGGVDPQRQLRLAETLARLQVVDLLVQG